MEMSVLMDSAMLMEVVWTLMMASLVSVMKDMKAMEFNCTSKCYDRQRSCREHNDTVP